MGKVKRQEQSKKTKFSTLKIALAKGLESGISESTIPDIMKKFEARMKAGASEASE